MRKSRMLAVSLAALAVVAAGAVPVNAAGAAPAGPAAAVSQHGYDGKTVYRGLILGIGPVAEKFPEIGRPAGGVSPVQAQFADQLIAAVEKQDPGFFTTFGQDMASGDRVRIDRAFTSAQNVTRAAMAERFGLKSQSTAAAQSSGLAIWVVAVYLGNVYEIVNVYKVANAVRESNVYEIENWTESVVSKDMARLDRERFVNLVAERLSA
ncbi:hypothetical protein Nocox_14100 [Nonomuraea coxensis DSM 45129]|uniref:SdpC family antimicrobial peptide n=1 Tax=Nonomuraea coxensis DSM 45129 TaxID=1122611 RepID=A0ABX8TYV9_9ACTN|nr:hypothetical protein [Nonomuraea coxensis]QYC40436.1 hypothetical protein Nocox_14100 [Nonomuraea coxensis DSM 45129]